MDKEHQSKPLTSVEVIRRTGVTYRQLYHWASNGWIPGIRPKVGSGSAFPWTEEHLPHVVRLAKASEMVVLVGRNHRDRNIREVADRLEEIRREAYLEGYEDGLLAESRAADPMKANKVVTT